MLQIWNKFKARFELWLAICKDKKQRVSLKCFKSNLSFNGDLQPIRRYKHPLELQKPRLEFPM